VMDERMSLKADLSEEDLLRDELTGKGYTRADFERNRKNYLVEAGAGAGKTFIMVQRIINQLVTGYYEPEDIVAITFTNKSTLELRERLDEELENRRKDALEARAQAEAAGDMAAKAETEDLLRRLAQLLRESGRMQVSTIHSFCQTMLEAMPFASPYGLDLRVLENDTVLAESFFDRKMAEQGNTLFRAARDLGMPLQLIRKTFLDCRENNEAVIAYRTVSDPVVNGWEQKVAAELDALQRELHQSGADGKYVYWTLRSAVELDPMAFAQDQTARGRLLWTLLTRAERLPLNKTTLGKQKEQSDFRGSPAGQKLESTWCGGHAAELRKTAPLLFHSYLMEDVEQLLAAYRAE